MTFSLRGLLELYEVPFHAAFAIPSRNREYHDTFYTLCRGALLFPQTSLALLPKSYFRGMRPVTKYIQIMPSSYFVPYPTHCNNRGQRPPITTLSARRT